MFLAIFNSIILFAILYLFLSLFLEKRDKQRWWTLIFFISLNYYMQFNGQVMKIQLLIASSYSYLFSLTFFKGKWYKRIFSLIIVILFVYGIELIIINIFSTYNIYSFSILGNLIKIALFTSFFLISLFIKKKIPKEKLTELLSNKKHLIYISIGLLFYLFSLTKLQIFNGVVSYNNAIKNKFVLVQISVYPILLGIIFYLLHTNNKLKKFNQYKFERKIYLNQSESYKKQLKLIDKNQEKIRNIRHDFFNHITTLQGLIEKDKEKALNYISNIHKKIQFNKQYVNTVNQEINSLLNYKINITNNKNIEINHNINITETLNINPFDLNIIIGNLLDNAIEAVDKLDKNRKISLTIKLKKGLFKIKVSNPYNGKIKTKKNKILTNKGNKKLHGIGLKNVKNIVNKYDGKINIDYSNNIFDINIVVFNQNIKKIG